MQVQNTTVGGNSSVSNANIECFVVPAASSAAGIFGAVSILIPDYSGSTLKSASGNGSGVTGTAADCFWRTGAGWWNNTAAITSVAFSTTFAAGSSAVLIGTP